MAVTASNAQSSRLSSSDDPSARAITRTMHAALALLVPAAAARMLEFDVTLADGERRWLHLPWAATTSAARDFCALYSVSARLRARRRARARPARDA